VAIFTVHVKKILFMENHEQDQYVNLPDRFFKKNTTHSKTGWEIFSLIKEKKIIVLPL